MSSAGVGVDIVELARMDAVLSKTPNFAIRFFTAEERALAAAHPRPAVFYAGRFAGHEAVLKALGSGLGNGVGRRDVSVLDDGAGQPRVELAGGAARCARDLGVVEVALSLSFTENLVVASALALTVEARPKPPEAPEDPKAELARSFRDARVILSDLDRIQEQGVRLPDSDT